MQGKISSDIKIQCFPLGFLNRSSCHNNSVFAMPSGPDYLLWFELSTPSRMKVSVNLPENITSLNTGSSFKAACSALCSAVPLLYLHWE